MPDRPLRVGALLLLALVLAACGSAPPAAAPALGERQGPTSPAVVRAVSTPRTLDVPRIGVRATGVVDLGLTTSGGMEVPDDAVTLGWFSPSPVPGEPGPAVLAGHVNWSGKPGIFARLHELAAGDTATVTRSDGRVAAFTVYRVERYAKAAFPTAEVYGNTAGPELRLVTCGGDFDRATGHYVDNVVVYARAS